MIRLGITLAAFGAILVIYKLGYLLLLVFAAALVAIVLHAMADPMARRFRLPIGVCLTLSIVSLAAIIAAIAAVFGREIGNQLDVVADRLPGAAAQFLDRVENWGLFPEMLEAARDAIMGESGATFVAGVIASTLNALGAIALAVVGGIYLAAQPALYSNGLLALFPKAARTRIETLGGELIVGLKHWLLGQLVIMAFVGTLTGLGAWALGLPAPLALGIIAGLLEFVPYLGPILTVIPAMLLGFTVSLETALLALGWLLIVQQIEGYAITPLVQRKAVSLPPAISLFALLAAGLLLGVPGVLLALPLAVVCYVIYQHAVVGMAQG